MLSLIIPKIYVLILDCAERCITYTVFHVELEERLSMLRSEIENQEERTKSAEKEG